VSGVRVPAPPPFTPRPRLRLRRLEPVLRRALRASCSLPTRGPILVALSGGADSTALLLGLRSLAHELGLTLHAAHLHHGLRGAEADADQAFVRDLCARAGIPLTAARWNCRARMATRGLSGQAGLRTLRREFLARVARRVGAGAIATAHTADDQLETMLLRLLRGTGLPGLGGMSPRRGTWIKPMLAATRDDVERDLREIGQPWREDRTNRDPRYARSRVRHDAIPALLRALDPSLSPDASPERLASSRAGWARRAAATARELRSARRTVTAGSARILARVARIHSGEIELDSRTLGSYPFVMQRTVLRLLWRRAGPAGQHLTEPHLNALQSLLAGPGPGARVDLPSGRWAERERGLIVIRRAGRPTPLAPPLAVPDRGRWVRGAVRGGWVSGAAARRRLQDGAKGAEFFAADQVHGGLTLRPAQPDEWFTPFGGRGPGRLREFLKKQPVPRALRAHPTVLSDARGILWVVGVRRAARAAVTEATRRALWVHTENA
jgi:tRNA(Ile)-lysidine synthase